MKNYVLRLWVSGKPMLTTRIVLTGDSAKVIASVAGDLVLNAVAEINLPEEYKISIDSDRKG